MPDSVKVGIAIINFSIQSGSSIHSGHDRSPAVYARSKTVVALLLELTLYSLTCSQDTLMNVRK